MLRFNPVADVVANVNAGPTKPLMVVVAEPPPDEQPATEISPAEFTARQLGLVVVA
jgi:hypothetical protein